MFKRESTEYLQKKLTSNNSFENYFIPNENIEVSNFLKINLPNNFVYLHLKNETIKKLEWNVNDLNSI